MRRRSDARALGAGVWIDVAAIAAQALVFVPLAALRALDGDEGVYAYAAAQVMHGGLPYRDFFWEQMPLLPFVYGGWFRVFGASWYSARVLSALLSCAVGAVLYVSFRCRFGRYHALAATGLYVLSGAVFAWFVTVTTFPLSTLLLLISFVLLRHSRGARSRLALPASGLAAGLAIDTRLLFVAAVAVLAVVARRQRPWFAGLVVGAVPSLALFLLSPQQFVFDNVGYHGAKTSAGFAGGLIAKERMIERLLAPGAGDQFLLLVLGGLVAAVSFRRLRRPIPLALWVAAALILASLTPTPAYASYFCVTIPFLVYGVVESAAVVQGRLRAFEPAVRVTVSTTLVVAGLLYALASGIELKGLVRGGADSKLTIPAAEAVTAVVNANVAAGEEILSSWPGYVFASPAVAVPRTANPFVPLAAARLSPRDVRRHSLITAGEIERMIVTHRTRLVVFGLDRQWLFPGQNGHVRWDRAVTKGRYALLADLSMAKVYVWYGRVIEPRS